MAGQSSDREARAERYFEQDLKGQREWYGKRASAYKNYTQILGLVVIAAGVATSFLQVFTPRLWVPAVTAGLGALVALAEGWQRITRYGETWIAYRTASERMKRERRLYLNGAGAYRGTTTPPIFSWSRASKQSSQRSSRSTGGTALGKMVLRARPIRPL